MCETKHIIWSNHDVDYDAWKADLMADDPDAYERMSESERLSRIDELVQLWLDDERANLNIQLKQPILIIADFGRWNGRFLEYAEVKSGNIRDCLHQSGDCNYHTWYVDEIGDFRGEGVHHDGTNYYLYRAYRSDVSGEAIEDLKEKLCEGNATRGDLLAVTRSIGPDIGKVYGWTFDCAT